MSGKKDNVFGNASIYYEDSNGSHELHIGSNGEGHAHDNVDETRNGNATWDSSHRPLTDVEKSIVEEVKQRGCYN